MKLESLSCNGCGAPLDNTLVCKYCQGNHRLTGVEKHSNQSIGSYDDPIIIKIENKGNQKKIAKIYISSNASDNFSNDSDIIIKFYLFHLGELSTHAGLLNKTAKEPLKIGKIRFESNTPAQLQQMLYINQNSRPIDFINVPRHKDPYSYCNNIIEVRNAFTMNIINDYLSMTILPQSSITITMYPQVSTYINSTTNRTQEIFRYRGPKPLPLHFL